MRQIAELAEQAGHLCLHRRIVHTVVGADHHLDGVAGARREPLREQVLRPLGVGPGCRIVGREFATERGRQHCGQHDSGDPGQHELAPVPKGNAGEASQWTGPRRPRRVLVPCGPLVSNRQCFLTCGVSSAVVDVSGVPLGEAADVIHCLLLLRGTSNLSQRAAATQPGSWRLPARLAGVQEGEDSKYAVLTAVDGPDSEIEDVVGKH